jgi:hypothetical protein
MYMKQTLLEILPVLHSLHIYTNMYSCSNNCFRPRFFGLDLDEVFTYFKSFTFFEVALLKAVDVVLSA